MAGALPVPIRSFDTFSLEPKHGVPKPILHEMYPPFTNTVFPHPNNSCAIVSAGNYPEPPSRATHRPARKRKPKAPTMSAKTWKPAENRIRQLFVDQQLPYKEMMQVVNNEFGFYAT